MWTSTPSPVGDLRIVADQRAITAIEFAGPALEGASLHSSASRAAALSAERPVGDREDDAPLLVEAVHQLRAYFAGNLAKFDLPLNPSGTPFQRSVWDQLRGIDYGRTASYGEIAGRLGMKLAGSRAVGLANGRNPIPIIIPCHRVVGANGSLTGYAGGVQRKQVLLELEQNALF